MFGNRGTFCVAWRLLPGSGPFRGERMIDLDFVFVTGRAAFFALNGIVIALIAIYVLARPR